MLVAPLVLLLVLALLELVLTLHAHAVVAGAAEEAVRVAVAGGGDTAAGEARLRSLVADGLRPDAITSVRWARTLNTLTLRVGATVPVLGPLVNTGMVATASAYAGVVP